MLINDPVKSKIRPTAKKTKNSHKLTVSTNQSITEYATLWICVVWFRRKPLSARLFLQHGTQKHIQWFIHKILVTRPQGRTSYSSWKEVLWKTCPCEMN